MIPTEQIQMPVANCCIMTNVESQGSMSTWSLLLRKEEEKKSFQKQNLFSFQSQLSNIYKHRRYIKSEMLLCFEQLLHKNWPFCAICWSWFLACNMSRFCCFDSEQLLISMVINRPRKPLKNISCPLMLLSLPPCLFSSGFCFCTFDSRCNVGIVAKFSQLVFKLLFKPTLSVVCLESHSRICLCLFDHIYFKARWSYIFQRVLANELS